METTKTQVENWLEDFISKNPYADTFEIAMGAFNFAKEPKTKVANSNALSNVRGRIMEEIKEIFDKVSIEAISSEAGREKDKVVPLYLPNYNLDINIGEGAEKVFSLFTFADDKNKQIWVDTDSDFYALNELYADDLSNLLDYFDHIISHNYQKYLEFISEYKGE